MPVVRTTQVRRASAWTVPAEQPFDTAPYDPGAGPLRPLTKPR